MNFLHKIKDSIYNPQYYRDLLDKPFSYSIKYYLLFSLLFSVLLIGKWSIEILPGLNAGLREMKSGLSSFFPQDLEFKLEKGSASINLPEPYYIATPDSLNDNSNSEEIPKNFIVIDTGSSSDATNLEKYDTLLLVTKNHMIYKKKENEITTQSLAEVPDFNLNKDIVQGYVDRYAPYLYLVIPGAILVFFIGAIFMIFSKLLYLVFAALLVMLLANHKKVDMDYAKAYQVSLHLLTLPLLVITGLGINFPFATTIMMLVLALINFNFKKEIVPQENPVIAEVK